jgi:[acyl-carrier-protein] S-malonyltransferase
MQEAVPQGAGKMIAVLGKEIEELEKALSNLSEGVAEIANINAPGQVVIAGHAAAISEFLKKLGPAKSIEIPVSAPFHTSLMRPAEEKLRKDLASIAITPARFPVYANYSAQQLSAPEDIREALGRQVCSRVRWVEAMHNMISSHSPAAAIEFGSGNVLSNLLKRIDSSVARIQAGAAVEIEKLTALFNSQAASA